jgi:hypothetical protein
VRTRAALRQNNNNNKIKRVIDERQVRTRAALAKKQGIKKHICLCICGGKAFFFKRPTIERLVDALLYIINFIINGYYRVVPMLGLYYHIYGM